MLFEFKKKMFLLFFLQCSSNYKWHVIDKELENLFKWLKNRNKTMKKSFFFFFREDRFWSFFFPPLTKVKLFHVVFLTWCWQDWNLPYTEFPKGLCSIWLSKAQTKTIPAASGGEDRLIDDFGGSKHSFCFMFLICGWSCLEPSTSLFSH